MVDSEYYKVIARVLLQLDNSIYLTNPRKFLQYLTWQTFSMDSLRSRGVLQLHTFYRARIENDLRRIVKEAQSAERIAKR